MLRHKEKKSSEAEFQTLQEQMTRQPHSSNIFAFISTAAFFYFIIIISWSSSLRHRRKKQLRFFSDWLAMSVWASII